jgi:hypothetical protein
MHRPGAAGGLCKPRAQLEEAGRCGGAGILSKQQQLRLLLLGGACRHRADAGSGEHHRPRKGDLRARGGSASTTAPISEDKRVDEAGAVQTQCRWSPPTSVVWLPSSEWVKIFLKRGSWLPAIAKQACGGSLGAIAAASTARLRQSLSPLCGAPHGLHGPLRWLQQHKLHSRSPARPSTPLADLLTRLLPSLQPQSHPGVIHSAAWQRPGCRPRPISNSELVESRNRRACCHGSPRAAAHEEQRCAAQPQGRWAGGLLPSPLPPRGHRCLPAARCLPAPAFPPTALSRACLQVWRGKP